MRRFNPEKELYKIQHGRRDKLFIVAFLLLLIISISSTYALYQVRYSKRIIYTKVAPVSNRDLDLAIYVDGKPGKLPSKGMAYYEDIICDNENNLNVNWNYDKWIMNIPTIELPNKCSINFTTKPSTLIAQIEYDKKNNSKLVVDDETNDNNLRYIGANPSNYIWFNCDDYNSLTQATAAQKCEKWRIIGLMNNIPIVDEFENTNKPTKLDLVKIIRSESIGTMVWDKTGGTYGSNNWTRPADLQTSLTEYYNGKKIGTAKIITSATKEMIEQVTWNIGGHTTSGNTTSQFYIAERGSTTYNSQPSMWNGYIALMYPSDYGYAADKSCWSTQLSNYADSCKNSDWLYITSTYQWTLTPRSANSRHVFYVDKSGSIGSDSGAVEEWAVRPSLYLKSDVKMIDGDGSSEKPYILVP